MSVPSMVHRSGDTLVVRSVVSGDALFGSADDFDNCPEKPEDNLPAADKELPECKVKRNYSCGTCDFFTQNPRSYLYHLRDVHKEKVRIYECPNCLYASKHFQKLIRHTRMVHGSADSSEFSAKKGRKRPLQTPEELDESNESPTSADESSQPSPVLDEEAESITIASGEKSGLKCSVCSFVARSHVQLSKHEREEHIKTKFFRCVKCTYITHMKARFTKHVKYHSMPMIKCEMCDFRTPYKWNLDRHCKNHNGKGAFRCSACNFTADIKQSLTVHEMNHHVPPVGQAAGLGVGRRRNKVGASDTTAAEEAASQVQSEPEQCEIAPSGKTAAPRLKIPTKKPKSANSTLDTGSDFVHPDDIVQRANGNVYIKSKCRLCNFKTAWDGEMARHEERVHGGNNLLSPPKKRPSRPVPNLIPIAPQKVQKVEPAMSQKDINDICARSINSSLRDFASLFGSEDVFPQETNVPKLPDLISKNHSSDSRRKGLSIFDKMEELSGNATEILTCRHCGHRSKCVTESYSHQKSCGKEAMPPASIATVHTLSSTRCQYCRQRCKSSKDLLNHLQTCTEAAKYFSHQTQDAENDDVDDDNDNQLQIITEDDNSRSSDKEPHPMENKVFVWNNIEVPLDVKIEEPSQFEYVDDKPDDNISVDTTRTHSPVSESSNVEVVQPVIIPSTDKIPTHGNDISIAQHKRVFKCPHCTFWASTASRFHVHIVGHLNKKPFECSLCAYRSNWRWDITKHIKLKSVRDPKHEDAKVLMTDETGRRNYTKYNKYLTEIHVSGGPDSQDQTSGGMGTRPKHHVDHKQDLPKAGKNPSGTDFGTLLSKVTTQKPLPALRTADEFFNRVATDKKRANDGKKTFWQCKKCNFRDPCKEKLLIHVKGHVNVPQTPPSCSSSGAGIGNNRSLVGPSTSDDLDTEASAGGSGPARGQAPFRCGHCHQVSNWKHVIQRHCRLKHSGDIKVIVAAKSHEKTETDHPFDDLPEHQDIQQPGQFKCNHCPFACDCAEEYQMHSEGHQVVSNVQLRCHFCGYSVTRKEDLYQHFVVHGILDHNEYIQKLERQSQGPEIEPTKRYKCAICPYVTNSKSQFMYHKQFHQQKNGQYRCSECSYNVSKRHLLHQHMKVHGISISPQKQNGETIDLEEMSEEIEEIHPQTIDWQSLTEIPLVWVSKNGKLSKMYKCRYCPHVNLRKVNIQEHEKMHGMRERNSSRGNDTEHRCPECNYVCNNAGVLSSHSKVHQQGLYGTVHGIVDSSKTDEEQIREMGHAVNSPHVLEAVDLEDEAENRAAENNEILYFCSRCPARFFNKTEYDVHTKYHSARIGPHRCDYCPYAAHQKPHLATHHKVHTKEYNDRTKILLESCVVSSEYPPPEVTYLAKLDVWAVDVSEEVDYSYSVKSKMSVPLSGTDLFQQKSEAEKMMPDQSATVYLKEGNLRYVHPSYLKNGKVGERCYKCPKCRNSFDTYEECKSHIELHNFNSKRSDSSSPYDDRKDKMDFSELEDDNLPKELTTRRSSTEPSDQKKMYWCTMCPYTNQRKDVLDSHQKRHVTISGTQNNHTCQHCDYSVPQSNYLREHTKLHFSQNKMHTPDAYMSCDSLKLTTKSLTTGDEAQPEEMVFENKDEYAYEPLKLSVNNNESEKVYIDTKSGEIMDGEMSMDTTS